MRRNAESVVCKSRCKRAGSSCNHFNCGQRATRSIKMHSSDVLSVGFTTNPFDRLNNQRHDVAFLKAQLESEDSVFLLFKAVKPLLKTENLISIPYVRFRHHLLKALMLIN